MAAVGLRVQSMPSPAATALIFDNPAMNARSAASPLSFELKNMHLPLMSVLLKTADLHQLGEDLQKRFGDTPDFFDNDPVLIDLQSLDSQSGPLDMPGLLQLLKRHRMNPVAVRTQVSAHEAAATLAGLFVTQASRPMPASPATAATETVREVIREVEVVREVTSSTPSAMVVDKPLRSGQHVYAKGRDLVVLSMVNPGAEIMADGHIHVYAPLRGKAIAGARGDEQARIFTHSLEAELISIAGTYRTIETPLAADVLGKPAQELVDALGHILEAQTHTLKLMKPGASCKDIIESHNAFMRSRGLPEEKRLYAHGQGYDMVERPLVRQDEPMLILENMNMVVHPGMMTERLFMTNTDNYIIGPDGPVAIHTTPEGSQNTERTSLLPSGEFSEVQSTGNWPRLCTRTPPMVATYTVPSGPTRSRVCLIALTIRSISFGFPE